MNEFQLVYWCTMYRYHFNNFDWDAPYKTPKFSFEELERLKKTSKVKFDFRLI